MGRPARAGLRKQPETVLQAVFLKRVKEEMEAQGLTPGSLALREEAPAQKTIDDVMKGAVPKLTFIYKIAVALGVHPWELMRERAPASQEILTAKVHQLPKPAKIFGGNHNRTQGKAPARNKSRA